MKFSARDYRMPRYKEIPNVGLYLEQTVKYINECLAPIEISITPSMLSNYVKKGYIDRPVKKQYYADQIAYAIYIVIIKQVLSMDNKIVKGVSYAKTDKVQKSLPFSRYIGISTIQ